MNLSEKFRNSVLEKYIYRESEMSTFKCKKKSNRKRVLAWMIYMKFNVCNVLCINWLLVQHNDKKKITGVGGNGSYSTGSGKGQDFPPIFSWEWDGRGLKIHSRVTL